MLAMMSSDELVNVAGHAGFPRDAAVDRGLAVTGFAVLVLLGVGSRLGQVGGERLGHALLGLGPVTAMWMALGYCWPLKRQPRSRMKSLTW
jgi:hypothetical protein